MKRTIVDPKTIDGTSVDLHSGEPFCVDVTTYPPVKWVEENRQKCDVVFEKQCENITQIVSRIF